MVLNSPHRVPAHLADTTLIVPPRLYESVCLPLRASVGVSLLLAPWWPGNSPGIRWGFLALAVVLAFAALGLYRKWQRLGGGPPGPYPGGWKNFRRAVAASAAASVLLAGKFACPGAAGGCAALPQIAGAVIVADAAMGLASKAKILRRRKEGVSEHAGENAGEGGA
jgi:hypothetical protein